MIRKVKSIDFSKWQDDDLIPNETVALDVLNLPKVRNLDTARANNTFSCPYHKIGKRVYYRVKDLKDYLASKRIDPAKQERDVKDRAASIAA